MVQRHPGRISTNSEGFRERELPTNNLFSSESFNESAHDSILPASLPYRYSVPYLALAALNEGL
jgi:hypothetical protein